MWWILFVEVVCMLFATALLLHQYGDLRKTKWYVTLIVLVTWWVNFNTLFITPVDISAVRNCRAFEIIQVSILGRARADE
jgi:hypothetical protein